MAEAVSELTRDMSGSLRQATEAGCFVRDC
jgi:hypothetical protein